jgi:guanylate kinase
MKQALCFVISAPSGCGKSSLTRALCNQNHQLKMSISYTTRSRRSSEVNGVDYFFITDHEFDNMVNRGEFIEYATVYGAKYGTQSAQINNYLNSGYNVLLEIDYQGAMQIKKILPTTSVLIYILPPSIATLQQRLRNRNTDDAAVIANRLNTAGEEVANSKDFDFVITNDNFDVALRELNSIINKLTL